MGFILGGDPQPAGHRLAGWLLADFRQNQAAGKVSHFQEAGAQSDRTEMQVLLARGSYSNSAYM
jgi:hypothetical protein